MSQLKSFLHKNSPTWLTMNITHHNWLLYFQKKDSNKNSN